MKYTPIIKHALTAFVAICTLPNAANAQTAEQADVAELTVQADAGDVDAQFKLGTAYRLGEGVAQDSELAVRYYRMAADQGHAAAQLYLGAAYYFGEGVLQDRVQAHKWFDLSAAGATDDGSREIAVNMREMVAEPMTRSQIAEAQRLATEWQAEFAARQQEQ